MTTREKLIVYGGAAIGIAIVIPLAVFLVGVKTGLIDIDLNDWFFPPGGGLGEAYLRLGGAVVATVAVLTVVGFWGKAVQRIMSGAVNPTAPTPDDTSESN